MKGSPFRTAGTFAAPFLVQTAFIAFAPRIVGLHPYGVLVGSIAAGLLFQIHRDLRMTPTLVVCAVYVPLMCIALVWWTFILAAGYFPDHTNEIFPGLDL